MTPLRIARKRLGLTIMQVSSATGVDIGDLSRMERGIKTASKSVAEKLARFYAGELTEMHIIYPERYGSSYCKCQYRDRSFWGSK